MELAAGRIVFERSDVLLLGRRARERHCASDFARLGKLQGESNDSSRQEYGIYLHSLFARKKSPSNVPPVILTCKRNLRRCVIRARSCPAGSVGGSVQMRSVRR